MTFFDEVSRQLSDEPILVKSLNGKMLWAKNIAIAHCSDIKSWAVNKIKELKLGTNMHIFSDKDLSRQECDEIEEQTKTECQAIINFLMREFEITEEELK